MSNYLISWIDKADLNASKDGFKGEFIGPILNTLKFQSYEKIFILNGYKENKYAERYGENLKMYLDENDIDADIFQEDTIIKSPIDFDSIYESSYSCITKHPEIKYALNLDILVSSGSAVMHGSWFILSQVLKHELNDLKINLISSSIESGIDTLPSSIASLSKISDAIARRENNTPIAGKHFESIIGNSLALRNCVDDAKTIAKYIRESVIIEGETGTGKEQFARSIHFSSQRSSKPFESINCGSMQEDLFRAELFGYKKGSFTGAEKDYEGILRLIDGGSLFLDELSDLSLNNQRDLLRFLEDGKVKPVGGSENDSVKVDIRIIGATNKNLAAQVAKGLFRKDLYFRLNVLVLSLPELKNRKEDIEILLLHFIKKFNEDFAKNKDYKRKIFSEDALTKLKEYSWPGNIRELQATIKRILIQSKSYEISLNDIKRNIFDAKNFDNIKKEPLEVIINTPLNMKNDPFEQFMDESFDIKKLTEKIQRHYVELALSKKSTKSQAAKMLGLSAQNLEDWIKRLEI